MDNKADQTATWRNKQHRMRLECRECDVICQRVVHPWHCLTSNCEYVYAYEDSETMYFGCLYKVFPAEFDMAVFSDSVGHSPAKPHPSEQRTGAPAKSELASRGSGRRRIKKSDPYGPVRVTRTPRPQCKVRVEQAYDSLSASCVCCNPTFFHDPFTDGHDAIKLTAMPPADNVESQG